MEYIEWANDNGDNEIHWPGLLRCVSLHAAGRARVYRDANHYDLGVIITQFGPSLRH